MRSIYELVRSKKNRTEASKSEAFESNTGKAGADSSAAGQPQRVKPRVFAWLLPLALLAGCSIEAKPEPPQPTSANPASGQDAVPRELTISKNTVNSSRDECKGTLDYLGALMLNDSYYFQNRTTEQIPPGLIGEKITEVGYTLSDDACQDYVMRNGDATLVPTGTPIYKMHGYRSSFRVIAGGQIFEVNDNPQARTIGDLYDIEGKVLRISRESGNDGSHMWDFSAADTEAFIADMLSLNYVGFDEIYKNNPPENNIFLRIHLRDGTSMRITYGLNANTLTSGAYGTERMREIVLKRP
ncbi:hypothetical protein [Saccharibacillus brassicae]|uniref:Uncharacterized protein n=1 Tax=Saccharibacillus brassicae TaxID=2583377 RepID=A0A4Y6UZY7_SACBS|nr:hypothetical protein [Saccharibacillus brassicae]QDH22098.1 hypothetical protein FFV09_15345 [Saccharibacillus brassicae]